MEITRDEARRIADLAHLEFDDASLDRLASEMTKILGYIDKLRDAEGIEAPASMPTPLRDDVARTYPRIVDGPFVVPKVIE
ncbi:MAG TPA: Asp-tRNA(Asn)/Glu-tRNA(Gln) amidotransferase subunit GatC [Thermoanaerobaculia bacterium]|nr:Asp-tRNA(Asn)/Glu-tRNA(Gln) amidotransferase subunit GatC [Thermoanaerobaculia bacterium]